jgi:hypothetical protein
MLVAQSKCDPGTRPVKLHQRWTCPTVAHLELPPLALVLRDRLVLASTLGALEVP